MKTTITLAIYEHYEQDKFEYFRGFLKLLNIDFSWDWWGCNEQIYKIEVDEYEYMLIIQVLRLSGLHYEKEQGDFET